MNAQDWCELALCIGFAGCFTMLLISMHIPPPIENVPKRIHHGPNTTFRHCLQKVKKPLLHIELRHPTEKEIENAEQNSIIRDYPSCYLPNGHIIVWKMCLNDGKRVIVKLFVRYRARISCVCIYPDCIYTLSRTHIIRVHSSNYMCMLGTQLCITRNTN